MKFAKGPLYAALTLGVIGVALLVLPRAGFALPFEGDLVAAGLGLLAVLLLVVSLIMGARSGSDEDYDAITEDDLVPTVAFGPRGALGTETQPLTSAEKKARKQAEKVAKKEEAQRLKFEKNARREAEKAAKKASKGGGSADASQEWIDEIRQSVLPMDDPTPLDETTAFGSAPQQPVFQPQPVAPQQPVFQTQPVAPQQPVFQPQPVTPAAAAAAAMFAPAVSGSDNFGVVENNVDLDGAARATDAPMYDGAEDAPSWVSDAYNDPSFAVPFADPVQSDEPATSEIEVIEVPDGIDVVVDEIAQDSDAPAGDVHDGAQEDSLTHDVDEPVVNIEDTSNDDEPTVVEESVYSDDSVDYTVLDDVDASLDEEVEDESVTEVEERLDRLAQDVLAIIDTARSEVRTIRRESEAARRRHNEQVSNLAVALDDSRDEMTRLADELAEASQHQRAALDAQATLAQAQVEAQKAELERQEAVARLRQVRVAVLRKEPVDTDLLAVVEKSLSDLIGDNENPTE